MEISIKLSMAFGPTDIFTWTTPNSGVESNLSKHLATTLYAKKNHYQERVHFSNITNQYVVANIYIYLFIVVK